MQTSHFFETCLAPEVAANVLGEEWQGYVAKTIVGINKQGFPMKRGILTQARVCRLLSTGHSCRPRRAGERKHKSVLGGIVGVGVSVVNLVIVKNK